MSFRCPFSVPSRSVLDVVSDPFGGSEDRGPRVRRRSVRRGHPGNIDVRRCRDRRMPEPAGDDVNRDPVVEHEGRVSVPGVVEANLPEAGVPGDPMESVREFARANRFPVEVGRHEVRGPSAECLRRVLLGVFENREGRHVPGVNRDTPPRRTLTESVGTSCDMRSRPRSRPRSQS